MEANTVQGVVVGELTTRPQRRIPWHKIGLASMGLSILPALVSFGSSGGGTGAAPGPACLPAGLLAAVMFFWPIAALTVWVLIGVTRESVRDLRRYQAWKKTLTPQQLAAVRAAELVALIGVEHAVHKHMNSPEERAKRQAIQDQIMGGTWGPR